MSDMIKWRRELYMDGKVAADPERYRKMVEDRVVRAAPVYLVTVPSNGNNILDIISGNEIVSGHYKRTLIEIVGIAHSYKEAVWIVCAIVMKAYNEAGGKDINEYIRNIIYENPE